MAEWGGMSQNGFGPGAANQLQDIQKRFQQVPQASALTDQWNRRQGISQGIAGRPPSTAQPQGGNYAYDQFRDGSMQSLSNNPPAQPYQGNGDTGGFQEAPQQPDASGYSYDQGAPEGFGQQTQAPGQFNAQPYNFQGSRLQEHPYQESPEYQWQKDQLMKDANRVLNIQGRTGSTYGMNSMMKSLMGLNAQELDKQYGRNLTANQTNYGRDVGENDLRYSRDLNSNQMDYGRYWGENDRQYGRVSGLAQMGQRAAEQQAQMDQGYGSQAAGIYQGLGGQMANAADQYGSYMGGMAQNRANQYAGDLSGYGNTLGNMYSGMGQQGTSLANLLAQQQAGGYLNYGQQMGNNAWNYGNPMANNSLMAGQNNAMLYSGLGGMAPGMAQTLRGIYQGGGGGYQGQPSYNPSFGANGPGAPQLPAYAYGAGDPGMAYMQPWQTQPYMYQQGSI